MTLHVEGLTVRFGSVCALDSLSLECRDGELTGMIGPNGAGKTTFIDAVTGFVPATGRIMFDGQDVSTFAPHKLARLGLRRTWQSLELFDDIKARANVEVAARTLRFSVLVRELFGRGKVESDIDSILQMLGLDNVVERLPRELSQGQRKLLGVARALAGQPRLLLLDEPAAGLDRRETIWLGQQLRALADSGQAMLLVDHDMSLVLTICDRVHVLKSGGLIASGAPDVVRKDRSVRDAYLGTIRHRR